MENIIVYSPKIWDSNRCLYIKVGLSIFGMSTIHNFNKISSKQHQQKTSTKVKYNFMSPCFTCAEHVSRESLKVTICSLFPLNKLPILSQYLILISWSQRVSVFVCVSIIWKRCKKVLLSHSFALFLAQYLILETYLTHFFDFQTFLLFAPVVCVFVETLELNKAEKALIFVRE